MAGLMHTFNTYTIVASTGGGGGGGGGPSLRSPFIYIHSCRH